MFDFSRNPWYIKPGCYPFTRNVGLNDLVDVIFELYIVIIDITTGKVVQKVCYEISCFLTNCAPVGFRVHVNFPRLFPGKSGPEVAVKNNGLVVRYTWCGMGRL